MVCRFCGQECTAGSSQKLWTKYGIICNESLSKKHILISDGVHCIYCGHECKPVSTGLITKFGKQCPNSPSKKHSLQ